MLRNCIPYTPPHLDVNHLTPRSWYGVCWSKCGQPCHLYLREQFYQPPYPSRQVLSQQPKEMHLPDALLASCFECSTFREVFPSFWTYHLNHAFHASLSYLPSNIGHVFCPIYMVATWLYLHSGSKPQAPVCKRVWLYLHSGSKPSNYLHRVYKPVLSA